MIKILIVEDEPIISEDIAHTLTSHGYEVVGKAYNSSQALDMIVNRSPDLILLDIAIKGNLDGIDIGRIISQNYNIPYMYITSFSDSMTLTKVKETSPIGYIVKPFKDSDILTAIELGMHQFNYSKHDNKFTKEKIEKQIKRSLTKSEYLIIQKIWEGLSNQQIADNLFVSIHTIKSHTQNIFDKCNVKSRHELMAFLRLM
ncbi:MAG: response regulator transcription factor [Saprospiraceae bacterium]